MESFEKVADVGGVGVVTPEGGLGRPLLMLHGEPGFPRWARWNEELAAARQFAVPLQLAFERTPRVDGSASWLPPAPRVHK